jgi:hypothetical protein
LGAEMTNACFFDRIRPRVATMLTAAFVLGLSALDDARAFGDTGPKVVAVIAYERPTPAARARVDAMLAADSGGRLAAPDFVSRATWADQFRDSYRSGDRLRYSATNRWHFLARALGAPDLAALATTISSREAGA